MAGPCNPGGSGHPCTLSLWTRSLGSLTLFCISTEDLMCN